MILFLKTFITVFQLILTKVVSQLIVSEQDMCVNGQCKKMLNGHLVIQNNQDVSLNFNSAVVNGKNAKEVDPGSNGFKITIKKSPIIIAYDLTYSSTLYHDFQEDIKLFSFSQAGRDPTQFCYDEIRNCQKVRDEYLYGTPNLPPGQKNWTQESPIPPGSEGTCCWCPELYVTLYTDAPFSRATLHCSWIQQRLWWNVYLSKSCPIWVPPWWTVFKIGGWNWQYSLTVELSWFSPNEYSVEKLTSKELEENEKDCKKNNKNSTIDCGRIRHKESGIQVSIHTLNSSSPSFYDPNFGASVQVISSGPPFGSANAKDLSGYIMLQPTYSPKGVPNSLNIPSLRNGCGKKPKNYTEEEINDCLKPTLIIPPEYVDLTGVSCDKIGTSIYTWSSINGRFCYHPPGTCQRAQIATFYKKVIEDYSLGKISEYSVQAQNPGSPQLVIDSLEEIDEEELNNSTNIQSRRFFLGYTFDSIFDTEIMFSVEASSVSWVATSSPGIITYIEPPPLETCVAMSSYGCPLKVYVKNSGHIDSSYVVQIPYCTKSGMQTSDVDPIMAQSRKIKADSTGIFTFVLGVSVLTGSEYKCVVVLYNSFSIQLDQDIFTLVTSTSTISLSGSKSLISEVIVNTTSLTNKKYKSTFSGNLCLSCGFNFWCVIANFGECIKLGLKCIGIVLLIILSIFLIIKLTKFAITVRSKKKRNSNNSTNDQQEKDT